MKKIAIIHFSPVERYPPTINWLNFLAGQEPVRWQARVFTTRPDERVHQVFHPRRDFIRMKRTGTVRKEHRSLLRYWNYFLFYTRTLLSLIVWRPDIVLYYETLSALPALLYKKFFRHRAELFVHYHEYISEQEYNKGIPLNKWPHLLERKYYPEFRWISHTNDDRMRMFMEENSNVRKDQAFILPNYPPRSWANAQEKRTGEALRIVYVGAVDLTTMYTAEFARWIENLGGLIKWDIYSSNITTEAKELLSSMASEHIRFMGSAQYDVLPGILRKYDIGVIMYKGVTLNHRFSVPNKLYEYLACNLDVWVSGELDSCLPLVTRGTFPQVIALNYDELDHSYIRRTRDRNGLQYAASPFYAEEVLQSLFGKMNLQDDKQLSGES